MLPANAVERADGITAGERTRSSGKVPGEDEHRGSATGVQAEERCRRVSICLDQRKIRVTEVSRTGNGQSRDGSTVGVFGLQREYLDPQVLEGPEIGSGSGSLKA